MSRRYEVVYIFDSALEEAQVNEHLERFHELLKDADHPDPITDISHWGKRTLAYPINNKEQGYYVVAQFESGPAVLSEFERAIKLDEDVLRYLVVINEGLATVPAPMVERGERDDERKPRREENKPGDEEKKPGDEEKKPGDEEEKKPSDEGEKTGEAVVGEEVAE